jgi:general stress protein CsbA
MITGNKAVRNKLYFTATVALLVALLLAGEFFTGGVVTHHLLAQADMPGISNWWGLVSLPLLAWLLFPSDGTNGPNSGLFGFSTVTMSRFVGAIFYGAIMAASFEFGFDEATGNFVLILIPVGIFYPLYRGELVVGFVMGLTYTFGGILPLGAAAFVAIPSLLLHSAGRFIFKKFKPEQ